MTLSAVALGTSLAAAALCTSLCAISVHRFRRSAIDASAVLAAAAIVTEHLQHADPPIAAPPAQHPGANAGLSAEGIESIAKAASIPVSAIDRIGDATPVPGALEPDTAAGAPGIVIAGRSRRVALRDINLEQLGRFLQVLSQRHPEAAIRRIDVTPQSRPAHAPADRSHPRESHRVELEIEEWSIETPARFGGRP